MSELKKINGPVNIVGELEATSLDINGAADISGALVVGGGSVFNGANNNSKISFIDVKRGTGAGLFLKFQTDSTSGNNVSQFVIRRSTDNVDILSLGATTGDATFVGDINVGANYIGRDSTDMIDFTGNNQIAFRANDASRVTIDAAQMYPNANNSYNLGHGSYRWNNLYFGDGSIIDFNADVTIQHSSNALTIAGGQLTVSGEVEATSLDINGNADISGNITGVDAFTASGKIQGAELEGTSLDINGNGDVSGTLNVTGSITTTGAGVNGNLYANRYFQNATGIPTNNLGAPTVTEMALFENQFKPQTTLANAYDDLADLTFFTRATGTGESDYSAVTVSDDQKRRFLRTNNSNVAIPNGHNAFRIEFVGKSYTFANAMVAYWSSQSHNSQVHVWKRRCDNNTWYQHTSSTATVSSWPGHLYLPFGTIAWHEDNTTSSGHYNKIRIEFTNITWSTGTYSDRVIALYGMQLWGGYPSGRRTVHSYDQNGKLNLFGDLDLPGTIYNAAWGGDVIPSSKLSTDTAHLSETQTFTGAKTFTGITTLSNNSNHYKGHFYLDAYDNAGNHYPMFTDGSSASGATVNWRQFYGSNYKTHTWTSDASGNMGFTYQGAIIAAGSLTATGLDINGSADISGSLTTSNTLIVNKSQGTTALAINSAGNGGWTQYTSTNDGVYGYIGSGSHLLGTVVNDNDFVLRAQGEFAVSIAAIEKMRINASGNATFSGALTVGVDDAGHDVVFRGNTSGAYFTYDASEDGVVIVAPTDEVALGIRVVGGAQPTVPQFTVGRGTSQYLGIKVDDRISQVIHRQDETSGVMQMNQEIWDNGSGEHLWNWRSANGSGASPTTRMTLSKSGQLTVTGELEAASLDINGNADISGAVGIGTAPTSRNLSVFRGTAGSVATFQHYTDASNFAGLYINVSQADDEVVLNASGSSGGAFVFQQGNNQSLKLDTSLNATFAGTVTAAGSSVNAFTTVSGRGYSIASSRIVYYDGTTYLGNIDNQGSGSTVIRSAGSNTLVLEASQNATFASNVYVGGTLQVTGKIEHGGDSNTYFGFDLGNDTYRVVAGGTEKLRTAAAGIEVNGELQCDTLDVDGNADISGNLFTGGKVIVNQGSDLTTQAFQVNGFIDITDVTGTALRWYNGSTFRGGLGLDDWAHSGSSSDITMYISGDNSFHVSTNNVKRAEFNATGLNVVGELEADSLDIDGVGNISGNLDLEASFKWAKNQTSSYTYSAADGTGMYIERFSTAGANSTLADMRFQARNNNSGTYNVIRIKGSDDTIRLTTPNTHISGALTVVGKIQGAELEGTSLDINGNADITGATGASGNAFSVQRGSDNAQAFRVQNAGEVVVTNNYLYAAGSGTSMYVQNNAVFRGNISNDTANTGVTIADDLSVNGDITASSHGHSFGSSIFKAPDATASIAQQIMCADGANAATFRTTTSGRVFEIRSQNSGTIKIDSSNTTFTGNVAITGGNLDFSDGRSANFGNADDLQIYHDGSNSYINDTGTGRLRLKSSTQIDFIGANGESMANMIENGAVKLYHNNVQKLETTSAGVTVTGTLTATADVIAYSDERLKENVQTLDGKKVLEMRGVSFDRLDDGKSSSGVIAQELEKVAPELVVDDGDYKGVAYGNLVGYLIEAVKDQQKQIDELKAMINGNS